MKRVIGSFLGVSAFLLMLTGVVQASTLTIELKNGNSIEIGNCWEDGGSFVFFWRGGLVGISKEAIASIQETVADEPLAGAAGLAEAPECVDNKSDEKPVPTNLIVKKYAWGNKQVRITETPQGPKIEFTGHLIASAGAINSMDSFKLIYTNQFGEVIREKVINAGELTMVKEAKDHNEYELSDSLLVSSCPTGVEVYVTHYNYK